MAYGLAVEGYGKHFFSVHLPTSAFDPKRKSYESDAVLSYLFHHCERPNFQVRFRWEPYSIAFWDNRCTHHRALWDYYPNVCSGFRIQIEGTDTVIPG